MEKLTAKQQKIYDYIQTFSAVESKINRFTVHINRRHRFKRRYKAFKLKLTV